ncbi:hypothetical protein, partial [Klebsiella variicola]|uniref:hypothetical protein n=1 Tax=Klebsiella variicola TaxID=244366 RepID=UPI001A8E8859
ADVVSSTCRTLPVSVRLFPKRGSPALFFCPRFCVALRTAADWLLRIPLPAAYLYPAIVCQLLPLPLQSAWAIHNLNRQDIVPHLITALNGPLLELEQKILDATPAIERWFRLE